MQTPQGSVDDNQERDNSSSIPEWLCCDTFVMLVYNRAQPAPPPSYAMHTAQSHSMHGHSVWSWRVCDRRTLTCAYLLLLHTDTVHAGVPSPHVHWPECTLCVHYKYMRAHRAQLCRLPTRASVVRRLVILQPVLPVTVWSDQPAATLQSFSFTVKPPHLINWVSLSPHLRGCALPKLGQRRQ